MTRALSALGVICLLAVAGVQPGRGADAQGAELSARQPALPALAVARHASLVVAVRPESSDRALLAAVLPAPPALAIPSARALDAAPDRPHTPGSAGVPTRSARGPPVG